jgi:hypothetical protein
MNLSADKNEIYFKIRFNTTHGDTNLFWRIIVADEEYLVASIDCAVPTYSESSFDERAGTVKWHMAGKCTEFYIDESKNAFLK